MDEPWNKLCFHRKRGLDLTQRFTSGASPYIPDEDWAEESPEIKYTTTHNNHMPVFTAAVRKVLTDPKYVCGRFYEDSSGKFQWLEMPSYALVYPDAVSSAFIDHVHFNAYSWVTKQGPAHVAGLRIIESGRVWAVAPVLFYDFTRSYKIGSAYLCGETRLDIPCMPENAKYLAGETPLPHLITAQTDILVNMALDKLLTDMFGDQGALQKLLHSSYPRDIYDSYVVLRILDAGNGQQNSLKGPSVPEAITDVESSMKFLVERFRSNIHQYKLSYASLLEKISPGEQDYLRYEIEPLPNSQLPKLRKLFEEALGKVAEAEVVV